MRRARVAVPVRTALAILFALVFPGAFARAAVSTPDAVWDTLAGPIDGVAERDPVLVRDPVRHRVFVLDGGDLARVWSLSLPASGPPSWSLERLPSAPPPRYFFCAVFDSLRDRLLLFGGTVADIAADGVWALTFANGPAWTRLDPTGVPPPGNRTYGAALDPLRDRLLVSGGEPDTARRTSDLWALDLGGKPAWRALTPIGVPPLPRAGAPVAYDPWNDRLIGFGGYHYDYWYPCEATANAVPWTLSLGAVPAWGVLGLPSGPPPGSLAAGVIDPDRGALVLYCDERYTPCPATPHASETWELQLRNGPYWNVIPSSADSPPAGSESMIWSPERGSIIRFGGEWYTLFELAGEPQTWTLVSPPAPDPFPARRWWASLLADPVQDRLLVFAGSCCYDLWSTSTRKPVTWTQLPMTGGEGYWAMLVYDPPRRRWLAFNGGDVPCRGDRIQLVAYLPLDGPLAWVPVPSSAGAPPGRWRPSVTYDPVRDRVLLFGGEEMPNRTADCGYSQDDVWAFSLRDSSGWTELHPANSPGVRHAHGAAYEPMEDRLVVHGGQRSLAAASLCSGGSLLYDTWALTLGGDSLVWSRLAVGAPECEAFALDTLRDRALVLSEDMSVHALPLDGASAWRTLVPAGSPPVARSEPSMTCDAAHDRLLVYGGLDNADLYAFDFLEPLTRRVRIQRVADARPRRGPPRRPDAFDVAILGAATFRVDSIVTASLRLGGAPATLPDTREPWSQRTDVNGDGLPDLRLRFERAALHAAPRETLVTLTGVTRHGTRILGQLRLPPDRGHRPGADDPIAESAPPAPRELALRLAGAALHGRALAVRCALPLDAPARLEVLDVMGRALFRRALVPEAGEVALELGEARSLPCGVYLVRLTQAGEARTAKAVVLP